MQIEYVYYAIDSINKTMWDTNYVWKINSISMPSLVLGSVEPTAVSGDYFRKDLDKIEVNETTNNFENIFKTDTSDKNVQLLEDVILSDWTPVSLTNCSIEGNGKTITLNLSNSKDGYLGLFSVLDNCSISNLNIVVANVTANANCAGALAGKITSSTDTISTIKNVNITFENFGNVTIGDFGGVVGDMENTEISNVTVSGLNINANANIETIGSVVGEIISGSINNINANATICGTSFVGGVVGINRGTISNVVSNVIINYNKAIQNATIGGVVGSNEGVVIDTTSYVNICVTNANTLMSVGGVAGVNNNEISSTTITGDGIYIGTPAEKVNGTIYIGGLTAINNGSITSTNNFLTNVGTYFTGANYRVGGVASINNGNISKVLTTSNLNGNVVGGVVVEMNATGKTIDQVVVGSYNKESKSLSANTIKGDKYVAGVAVDFRAGVISNVQASSDLEGATTETRTSLIVLVFPNGAEIVNATIDSEVSGYGYFYRDAWVDFASYTNKSEFGYDSYGTNLQKYTYFNVYKSSASCGKITSVVINADYKNTDVKVQASMASTDNFAYIIPMGTDYNDVNNIKETSDFTNEASFIGKFTFNYAYNSFWNTYRDTTATLTFAIGSVWETNDGINLIFLNDVK